MEEPREVHGEEQAGMIQIKIDVEPYRSYRCCTKLDATISRKLTHKLEPTEIGGMVAFIMDKNVKAAPQKANTAAWIKELLQRGDMKAHDGERDLTHGVREAVQTLYDTETGMVEDFVRAYEDKLIADRIVFIDTFEIDKPYYLKGCGRQPLRMILGMLPQVLGTGVNEGRASCLLSPARLEQEPEKRTVQNNYSNAQVESKLISFYQTYGGFQVWSRRSVADGDEPTFMGRSI